MHIFLCYRREDTVGLAGRLYDRLISTYGDSSVFMDVDAIPIGIDFRVELSNQVGKADVLLALIGRSWLQLGDLSNPADYVRIEIEAALRRNIPVVPLLIGHDRVPLMTDLPSALADLAFRNAMRLDPGREFHANVDSLLRALDRLEKRLISEAAPTPLVKKETPRLSKSNQESKRDLEEWEAELSRSRGAWRTGKSNSGAAPPVFNELFVCMEGSKWVSKGAIVRGKDWAADGVHWYQVIYGHSKGNPGARWSIPTHTLSHVAPTWRPELATLSDAIFAKDGKKLESFTPAPSDG